jgi:fucose permease
MNALQLQRWRLALVGYYLLMGSMMTLWAVRLPTVKADLHATTLDLGLMGMAGAVGALSGVSLASRVIARFGTRSAMVAGFTIAPVAYFVNGLATQSRWSDGVVVVGVGYLVSSFGIACSDVAINIDASALERELGRAVLPGLHGTYSVGAVVGSAVGTLCAGIHASMFLQTGVGALLMLAVPYVTFSLVPGDVAPSVKAAKEKLHWRSWFDSSLLVLGVAILMFTISEGAANSWLALVMTEAKHRSQVIAGAVVLVFSISMVMTRLIGNRVSNRWNTVSILRVLTVAGLLGVSLVRFTNVTALLFIAPLFWGAGVALGFPLCISAGGRSVRHPARRVVFIVTFGYAAYLTGPPILGLVSQHFGLDAIPSVALVCLLIASVALGVGQRRVNATFSEAEAAK